MRIHFATLPRPIRVALRAGAELAAALPGLRPPTVDGFTMDAETWMGLQLYRKAGHTPISSLEPEAARAQYEEFIDAYLPRPVRPIVTDDFAVGAIPIRRFRAGKRSASGSTIVWFHGGGWVIGSLDGDQLLCQWMAERTGATVISVGYRRGPEHRFPAAHDDAIEAWEGIVSRADELEITPHRTAVAGSSAGAGLSAWVCIAARDRGVPKPAAQLLLYPATELVDHAPSRGSVGEGYFLDRELISWFDRHYLLPEQKSDPRVSLLRTQSLADLPPAVVVTAGFDPLRDEGALYADALRAAGVPVYYECAGGLIHGFVETCGAAETARQVTVGALARLCALVDDVAA